MFSLQSQVNQRKPRETKTAAFKKTKEITEYEKGDIPAWEKY